MKRALLLVVAIALGGCSQGTAVPEEPPLPPATSITPDGKIETWEELERLSASEFDFAHIKLPEGVEAGFAMKASSTLTAMNTVQNLLVAMEHTEKDIESLKPLMTEHMWDEAVKVIKEQPSELDNILLRVPVNGLIKEDDWVATNTLADENLNLFSFPVDVPVVTASPDGVKYSQNRRIVAFVTSDKEYMDAALTYVQHYELEFTHDDWLLSAAQVTKVGQEEIVPLVRVKPQKA